VHGLQSKSSFELEDSFLSSNHFFDSLTADFVSSGVSTWKADLEEIAFRLPEEHEIVSGSFLDWFKDFQV